MCKSVNVCWSACENCLGYDVLIDLCPFRFIYFLIVQDRCRIIKGKGNVLNEKNKKQKQHKIDVPYIFIFWHGVAIYFAMFLVYIQVFCLAII